MGEPLPIGVSIRTIRSEPVWWLASARRLDEAGYAGVWAWDHFMGRGDKTVPVVECWTILSAAAAATSRVTVAPFVANVMNRHPAVLARMASTLQIVSGGRLILGIGSGWFQKDYDQFGYDFGTVPSRLRQLDADLPRTIARMVRGNPPPHRRIPVLIGGGGEQVTLRITAQYADIWHGYGSARTFRHKNEVLDAWCRRLDRDPATIERSAGVGPDDVARGDDLLAAGMTQMAIGVFGRTFDAEAVRRWVAWRDERNADRG